MGQRSLVGYSLRGQKELDMTEQPHCLFAFKKCSQTCHSVCLFEEKNMILNMELSDIFLPVQFIL